MKSNIYTIEKAAMANIANKPTNTAILPKIRPKIAIVLFGVFFFNAIIPRIRGATRGS